MTDIPRLGYLSFRLGKYDRSGRDILQVDIKFHSDYITDTSTFQCLIQMGTDEKIRWNSIVFIISIILVIENPVSFIDIIAEGIRFFMG